MLTKDSKIPTKLRQSVSFSSIPRILFHALLVFSKNKFLVGGFFRTTLLPLSTNKFIVGLSTTTVPIVIGESQFGPQSFN